jgi:hypothetical protein
MLAIAEDNMCLPPSIPPQVPFYGCTNITCLLNVHPEVRMQWDEQEQQFAALLR